MSACSTETKAIPLPSYEESFQGLWHSNTDMDYLLNNNHFVRLGSQLPELFDAFGDFEQQIQAGNQSEASNKLQQIDIKLNAVCNSFRNLAEALDMVGHARDEVEAAFAL